MLNENRKRSGNIVVIATDLEGNVLDKQVIGNLITNVGLNMDRDLWAGTITDGEIKRVAVGHDNTSPEKTDTKLGNEFFRKQVTSQTESGVGKLITLVSFAPADAVGQIEEIGWFAGTEAGDAKDSGIMISRVLYSRNKTNLERLQVQRTDTEVEA